MAELAEANLDDTALEVRMPGLQAGKGVPVAQMASGIQTVLPIDDKGHITALNCMNTDTMFDMINTDSFSKIEFLVCKLPKLRSVLPMKRGGGQIEGK